MKEINKSENKLKQRIKIISTMNIIKFYGIVEDNANKWMFISCSCISGNNIVKIYA